MRVITVKLSKGCVDEVPLAGSTFVTFYEAVCNLGIFKETVNFAVSVVQPNPRLCGWGWETSTSGSFGVVHGNDEVQRAPEICVACWPALARGSTNWPSLIGSLLIPTLALTHIYATSPSLGCVCRPCALFRQVHS